MRAAWGNPGSLSRWMGRGRKALMPLGSALWRSCVSHITTSRALTKVNTFFFAFLWRTSSFLRVVSNIVCRRARHPRRGLHLLYAVRPPAVGHRFHGGHPWRFQKSIPGTTSILMYYIHNTPLICTAAWHPFSPFIYTVVSSGSSYRPLLPEQKGGDWGAGANAERSSCGDAARHDGRRLALPGG